MSLRDLLHTAEQQLKELTNLEKPDFRLEQVEYNSVEQVWDIVVSFLVTRDSYNSSFFPDRVYKRVKINNNNEVVGFYIYNDR